MQTRASTRSPIRSPIRSRALLILDLAHFFDHYFLLIFPTAALALAADWGLDYGEALALGAPLYAMFALGTPIAGWLGDRMDRRRLIAAMFFGFGLASLGVASAQGPIALAAGLGALGLVASIYHPVGVALLTELAPRMGRSLAVNGVFGNMGLACAALATGALCQNFGWRAAFAVPAVVALAMGVWALRAQRPTAETRAASDAAGSAPGRLASAPESDRRRVVALVLVMALFSGLAFNVVSLTLPKLFAERLDGLGGDLAWIGGAQALVFACAAFAQLPVGELLDRFGARPLLLSLAALETLALAAVAMTGGWPLLALTTALTTVMFAGLPISGWLIGRYAKTSWRSRIVAGEYMLSLGLAALVTPAVAALHGAGVGFDRLYLGLAAAGLCQLGLAALLPGWRPGPAVRANAADA